MFAARGGLDPEAELADLDGLGVEVHAVEVVLEDLPVEVEESALAAEFLEAGVGVFVGGVELVKGLDQNGAAAAGSRLPVAGTVARSQPIHVGDTLVYPWQDSPVTTGLVTGTTNFVELNPLPVTDELLQRGEQVFSINCAACHSKLGDGNGTPKRINAMAVVANLHDKRIVELADGELFNTISYGKNLMQGYAANLPVQDRWAAIAYLRALQLSRLGALDEVPEALRGTLKK